MVGDVVGGVHAASKYRQKRYALTMSYGASGFDSDAVSITTDRRTGRAAVWFVLSMHGLAIVLMGVTEVSLLGMMIFSLLWCMLNCLWLALLRRPGVASLLSLEVLVALTLLSRFKYDKLWMTIFRRRHDC